MTYQSALARPIKVYYHATFLKYDGTQEGYVGNVYKTPGPFSEFTYEQGGDQESVKYFFSKYSFNALAPMGQMNRRPGFQHVQTE